MALTKVIGRGLGVQGDTVTGDDAALGFTSAEGLIITGQGSTNDVTIKNDADTQVCGVPTGTDDLRFPDNAQLQLGTGGDFKIYHDATNNYILGNGAHPMQFYTNDTLALKIDTNGHITKPLQPAFHASPSSTISNLAIGQTNNVNFAAERFDRNADYNAGANPAVFTAPVTGVYQLNFHLYLIHLDTAADYVEFALVTSNDTYNTIIQPKFTADVTYYHMTMSVLADMDASDTAFVKWSQGGGGSDQADIGNVEASFSGYLVA
jgi:hypothetical protein